VTGSEKSHTRTRIIHVRYAEKCLMLIKGMPLTNPTPACMFQRAWVRAMNEVHGSLCREQGYFGAEMLMCTWCSRHQRGQGRRPCAAARAAAGAGEPGGVPRAGLAGAAGGRAQLRQVVACAHGRGFGRWCGHMQVLLPPGILVYTPAAVRGLLELARQGVLPGLFQERLKAAVVVIWICSPYSCRWRSAVICCSLNIRSSSDTLRTSVQCADVLYSFHAGRHLHEVALSAGSDTADLLGGFEQLEPARAVQVLSTSAPCRICTCSKDNANSHIILKTRSQVVAHSLHAECL
jgi:hypothetical protein